MSQPSRLSWKLLVAIVPAVVAAVSGIVALQYQMARGEITRAINKETAALAQRLALNIDELLLQRRRDLLTLAETPLIADYYRNRDFGLNDEAGAYRRELARYLANFAARTGEYARIAYFDEKGREVSGTRGRAADVERAQDEFFVKAREAGPAGWWTSSIQERPGTGLVIYYAKAIFDEHGKFKGVLVLVYDTASLRELLQGVVVGSRGRAYLQAEGGRRLEGRPLPPHVSDLLTAPSPMKTRPWTVVVEAPAEDFLGPLRAVRDASLLTAFLGLAALVAILLLVVRSITRPIAALVEAAGRIGAGDFAHRIRKPGTDELGTLSSAFNEMGERLDANRRETVQLQSQLIQAEKLSAVGQLISAVAHELNNPLGAISGYVQIAMQESVSESLKSDLAHAYSNVLRCRKVVDNLLFFVRKSRHERRRVELNETVRAALELLEYRLVKTEDVRVLQDLSSRGPAIVGDFQQIVQVLVNLINNACDSMAGPGRHPDGKRLLISTGVQDGRAFLRVEDNGPGLPPGAESRLFEPFFTTKAAGHGTGLGLSICQQIARDHGGEISVESRSGAGCAFRVEIPEGSEADFGRLEEEPAPARHPAVPGKRVLVADDEEDIAELIARVLREDGDEARVASGGAEALRLLASEPFDLVVSDLEMAQVNGRDVYRLLKAGGGDSPARVLFVTGDILNPKVLEFLSKTGAEYLPKPFDIEELRQAVRRLLSSRA